MDWTWHVGDIVIAVVSIVIAPGMWRLASVLVSLQRTVEKVTEIDAEVKKHRTDLYENGGRLSKLWRALDHLRMTLVGKGVIDPPPYDP